MNRKVTIEDIAKELRLAPSTVSRALNNTRPVNQKTKKKILDLAEKRGYRPNVMARHLAMQTSNLIGLIVPGFNSSLFTEIADAIEKVANDNGYRILLGNTQEKVELQDTYIDLLIEHRVAGVILAPVRGDYNMEHILTLK